jgi:GNAT superfamily N-acetyltransferase
VRVPLCDPAGPLPVTIHRLADEHLPVLARALDGPYADFYADRMPLQRDGRGFTLLAMARSSADPIGGVFVLRDAPDEREVRAELPGVPMLYKAFVAEAVRNRRVGTQLLGCTHELLRRLGHDRVALGVDTANTDAVRLYERLGYRRWPRLSYGAGETRYRIMVLDLLDGDRTRQWYRQLCACVIAAGRAAACPWQAA